MPPQKATQTRPPRHPGRAATHDPEKLLDLLADVAHAAAGAGEATIAERVSMPVFNRVKVAVDRDRGIADPANHPERTPTAEAIQMRFRELAGKPVKWTELVEMALRPAERRTQWFAALTRDEQRHDLTDRLVFYALWRVARERQVSGVGIYDYQETRDALVAADKERHGDDGLLERLLPTANQVLAYCEFSWEKARRLAGWSCTSRRCRSTLSVGRGRRRA